MAAQPGGEQNLPCRILFAKWQSERSIEMLVARFVLFIGLCIAFGTRSTVASPFCSVPVLGSDKAGAKVLGATTHERPDWDASWSLAFQVKLVSSLPGPILYPPLDFSPDKNPWTISSKNSLRIFGGQFPKNTYDTFLAEPELHRVLGLNTEGIYEFDYRDSQFHLIFASTVHKRPFVSSKEGPSHVNSMTWIARFRSTLLGTDAGLFVLDQDKLEAYSSDNERIGNVIDVVDLPVHKAVLLVRYNDVLIRHDNGSIETVIDQSARLFEPYDVSLSAFESQTPGRIVLRTPLKMLEVEMRTSRWGFSPVRWSVLMTGSGYIDPYYMVTLESGFLWIGHPVGSEQHGLERLESDGFHSIPGDRIDDDPKNYVKLLDVPSRGIVLIEEDSGLFVYDGKQVTKIPVSSAAKIEARAHPIYLPSLDKIFINTESKLLQLNKDLTLTPISIPFKPGFYAQFVDFPTKNIAVIVTPNDLFTLDRVGGISPIEGGKSDTYVGINNYVFMPERSAILVPGRLMLHLIEDQGSSSSMCQTSHDPVKR